MEKKLNEAFMASPSTSLSVVAATGGTELQTRKRPEGGANDVVSRRSLVEHIGNDQVQRIVDVGILDSGSQTVIDISKLLASVYDNLKYGLNEGELDEYTNRVSKISNQYRANPELANLMSKWQESRRELIKITKSSADQLDQNFKTVNIGRMLGSSVEILNSLNLNIHHKFCSIIASYAYSISPKLGLVTETAIVLAPHLRFMGFASSFFEIFASQVVINRVVKAMKKDKEMFEPLKEWFDETKELDETVKNLFPHGINKVFIESIDKALEDLGSEEKIFSVTVLSSLINDPAVSTDGKFLAKVFLFCRSDASKEWYNRMIMGDPPSDLERAMFYFRTELQQLEESDIDSGSKIEIAKCTADQIENSTKSSMRSILGRLILCGMSGMSIYYCYENLRSGSKHRYSSRLRDLSTNALLFLNKMERIRI